MYNIERRRVSDAQAFRFELNVMEHVSYIPYLNNIKENKIVLVSCSTLSRNEEITNRTENSKIKTYSH